MDRSAIVTKFVKFALLGLPMVAVAVPLNYFLVEICGLAPWLAYPLVLAVQVTVNFFICSAWIFERNKTVSLYHQYLAFVSGILLFRLLDWGLYVFMVEVLGWYFLIAQLLNAVLFAVLKFRYTQTVMEK